MRIVAVGFMLVFAAAAAAQNVKITPLGSHAGELCNRDRATLFEDPTGLRILYDAGQSVTGGDDPRLGIVHVVLLSHAHGDHMGDQKLKAPSAGTCQSPELVSAAPNTTSAEIAAAKNAALFMVGGMANFLGKKVEDIKGRPTPVCPQDGDLMKAPFAAACTAGVNLGGARTIRLGEAARGVDITVVPASHDSTVARALLSEAQRKLLEPDNTGVQLGQPSGYVIRFSNGLTIYLSGDTGIHSEMKTVVADYHKANLMLLNLGLSALDSPAAAHVTNELVRPNAVIVTHVNEAATQGGKLIPQSRTATYVGLVKNRPVHLALSGRTMEFDGSGKCVSGCN